MFSESTMPPLDVRGDRAVEAFLQVCSTVGWDPTRVPEAPDLETADFIVTGPGLTFVTEVKELIANVEESEQEARLLAGKQAGFSKVPGDRLRPLIKKANRQIKTIAQHRMPGLLAVCDTRLLGRLESYDVLTAMYGLQTVVIEGNPNPAVSPRWVGDRFGGERTVAPGYNRSVSAVAIIRQHPDPNLGMLVFHNRFATVAFDPSAFRLPGFRQFRVTEVETGVFENWEEV